MMIETVLMMGHKICFYEEIWIIIPKLSHLPLLIWSSDLVVLHYFYKQGCNKVICFLACLYVSTESYCCRFDGGVSMSIFVMHKALRGLVFQQKT